MLPARCLSVRGRKLTLKLRQLVSSLIFLTTSLRYRQLEATATVAAEMLAVMGAKLIKLESTTRLSCPTSMQLMVPTELHLITLSNPAKASCRPSLGETLSYRELLPRNR